MIASRTNLYIAAEIAASEPASGEPGAQAPECTQSLPLRGPDAGLRITNDLVGVVCQLSQMASRFISRFMLLCSQRRPFPAPDVDAR
jgi:hypothetical protein